MAYSIDTALQLVKDRRDQMPGFTERDERTRDRINGVIRQLVRMGVHVVPEGGTEIAEMDDLMLVVDMTVWQINNRDKAEDDPPWLRRRLRNRWFSGEKETEGT